MKKTTLLLILGAAINSFTACGPQNHKVNGSGGFDSDHGIVNGSDVLATDGIAKSVVALALLHGGRPRSFCTATLIGPNTAITAAHCAEVFEEEDAYVLFGLKQDQVKHLRKVTSFKIHEDYNNLTAEDEVVPEPQAFEVFPLAPPIEHIEMPPMLKSLKLLERRENLLRFSGKEEFLPEPVLPNSREAELLLANLSSIREMYGQEWNDVALLRFEGEMPEGFVPARILQDRSKVADRTEVILAGFGNTFGGPFGSNGGTLRKTKVKLAKFEYSTSEMMTDEAKSGTCNGDSGGPVFVESADGSVDLIGVTSRGDFACRAFGIYSFVPHYADWLLATDELLRNTGSVLEAAPRVPASEEPPPVVPPLAAAPAPAVQTPAPAEL